MNLYLIDGNSYVYRAFFALRGLRDSKGRPTNAIFGFTNTLLKILKEKRPDGIIVSFDTPHPTERHILFEDYKAHRPETPDELIQQLPHIRKIIEAFHIKIFMTPGYEADDVLATIAERASKKGANVFIVTSDKDMYQLVHDTVKIYDPIKDVVLDEAFVTGKLGVPPSRVTEYMALVGDAADNIPGIKGIGEKTARELLSTMTLDELLEHPERIKSERIRRLVSENVDSARLSKRLAEINREVPIDVKLDEFAVREPDWQALLSLFRDFEFFSLMRFIPGGPPPQKRYEAILSPDNLRRRIGEIKKEFSFDTEATGATGRDPMKDSLVGFSVCAEKGKAFYVPLMHAYEGAPKQMDKTDALDAIKPLIENEALPKIGHNLKYDMLIMRAEGVKMGGPLYDTMLASHLLNPLRADHGLENVCLEHLSRKKKTYGEVAGKKGFQTVRIPEAADYSCDDAELAFQLKEILFEKLKREELERPYFDIEMPLIYVLAGMEEKGVKIDSEKLGALSMRLDVELDALRKRIFFLAGEEFNINSPKQLGKVLFVRLGLKPGKKKKTGYSTDVAVLEELAKGHELPREVLEWRTLYKLKTTYVDVLPALINPRTGRLHTTFNQTVTATGRLSSTEPNLQNIPARGQWGRLIREAFIAEEGNVLIAADYSQIELRIMAHLSGDAGLTEAFLNDIDIHSRTASEIFGVSPERATSEMRRVAKTVNFGVLYGITPFGLSESLGISKDEAEKYIRQYFERHPGVKAYIERTVLEARERGFVKTLFGRKRPVPELMGKTAGERQLGERLAVNSPVQGTAAEVIKIAMINIDKELTSNIGWKASVTLTMQVHDELVFEAPAEEAEAVIKLVREKMEGAVRLSVPLKVDIGVGKNWGAMKSFD